MFNDRSLCSLSLLPPSPPWDAEFAGAFEFNEGEFILPKLFFFFFHLKHKFLRRSKKYQLESPHYLSFQQYTISCLTKYEVVLSKLCVPDLLVQCGAMIEVNIGQITCTEHGSLHLHNKIRHY